MITGTGTPISHNRQERISISTYEISRSFLVPGDALAALPGCNA
jgi:hypothetical protein